MGKAFFNGWALWEKMVFVLACAIVVTMLAGCGKLWYSHWRLRRYAALPPRKVDLSREKSIIRSLSRKSGKKPMVERRKSVNDGVEIPFGIRAIESGIEVDGVWISRTNTPLSSARQSFANGAGTRLSGISTSDAARNNDAGNHDISVDQSRSSVGSWQTPSRASHSLSMSSPYSSDVPSPETTTQPPRSKYPPHSYKRYENTRHFRASRSGFGERPISGYSLTDCSSNTTTSRNNSTSSTNPPVTPGQKRASYPPSSYSTSSPQDLDMLQQHRLSHAAETGQLCPRNNKKPGRSSESTPRTSSTPAAPPSSGESRTGSLSGPENVRAGTPTLSEDGVFDRHNPFTTPQPEQSRLQSADHRASSYSKASESSYVSGRSSNSGFSTPKRHSDVLREVNPGFCVLKPGTLDRPSVRFPVAQGRHSRSSSNESGHRRGRRLQKRRPSQDSPRRDGGKHAASPGARSKALRGLESPHVLVHEPAPQRIRTPMSLRPIQGEPLRVANANTSGLGHPEPLAVHKYAHGQAPSSSWAHEAQLHGAEKRAAEVEENDENQNENGVRYSFDCGSRPESAADLARDTETERDGLVGYRV